MTEPAAVLWDMDGLLVDSEPLWTMAEQELAATLGGTWDATVKAQIIGTRLDVAVPIVLRYYGASTDDTSVEHAARRLLTRMVELFQSPLPLREGASQLLVALEGAGVPMALVSSSYRVLVDSVLAQVAAPFAATLAGDEVTCGKPHPEPYLTAARLLRVSPRACIVLEDSPSGVQSGLAAGCAVVAIPSAVGVTFPAAPRLLVRQSLAGLTVRDLTALLES